MLVTMQCQYSRTDNNHIAVSESQSNVMTLVVMFLLGSWETCVPEHQLSEAAVISVSHAKENQRSLVLHTIQPHLAPYSTQCDP